MSSFSCKNDEDCLSDATITNSSENLSVISGDSDLSEFDSDKEADTAGQEELGEWLGQLQALTDELDGVRPSGNYRKTIGKDRAPSGMVQGQGTTVTAPVRQRPPKPAVPPKPPIDSFRYSMANMEDSPESDLDALLSELCQLETQLASGGPVDNLFKNLGNAFLANSDQQPHTTPKRPREIQVVSSEQRTYPGDVQSSQGRLTVDTSMQQRQQTAAPSRKNVEQRVEDLTEENTSDGQDLSLGISNRQPIPNGHIVSTVPEVGGSSAISNGYSAHSGQLRSGSPDNDSAFCDSSSMLSSESALSGGVNCGSSKGSAESSRASLNTPSPTQLSDNVQAHIRSVQEDMKNQNLSEAEQNAKIKAEKIKIALEKMKEASIKKLYVKFFTNDGGSKSLLVDERWSVFHILKHLAEKNRQLLNTSCAVVENYPDLYMERIYEDHELLVENILLWTRDSANKLYFTDRRDKYAMFEEPQEYLCAETSAERTTKLDPTRKQQLIEEFFAPSHVQPPETEGILYLKADGKKAWKKHYFVLRASGLYYVPKGKSKSSKDLVKLMNLEMNQVYTAIGWKKKYKAPTDFGFALKHPQIQVKASKYIKYICAEDEQTFKKWIVGLRIAKNGRQLFDSFEGWKNYLDSDEAKSGTFSLRNSVSAENCTGDQGQSPAEMGVFRDSVVMRPRSSVSQDSTEVKVRPRSADISRGGAKRNSRTLMQVDLPTIPSEPENFYSDETDRTYAAATGGAVAQNGVMSAAHAQLYASTHSNGSDRGRGSGSQTPTPTFSENSQNAANAFFQDSDSTTGTIKRQPPAGPMQGQRYLQQPAPRLPLTEQTAKLGLNNRRISGHSSGDSSSVNSGDFRGMADPEEENDSDEELPPPPPEIQAEVEWAGCLPPENLHTTTAVVHCEPSRTSPALPQPPTPLSNGSGGQGVVKRPPPPPKRSEGTRLSTTAPPIAPKPVIPMKPGRSDPPNQVPIGPQAPSVGGVDFNSELQRAMARRLQKIETPNCAEDETGNGFVPNSPSRTPRSKGPPPPPPKRQPQTQLT